MLSLPRLRLWSTDPMDRITQRLVLAHSIFSVLTFGIVSSQDSISAYGDRILQAAKAGLSISWTVVSSLAWVPIKGLSGYGVPINQLTFSPLIVGQDLTYIVVPIVWSRPTINALLSSKSRWISV